MSNAPLPVPAHAQARGSARRERSRGLLLEQVRQRGAATRAELADMTGLSLSAVAAAAVDLLAAGLLTEFEPAPRTAGRGRLSGVLRPALPPGHVAGIDFGHRHVRVALADTTGEVIAERLEQLDVDGHAEQALDCAADTVAALLAGAGLPHTDLLHAAAGIPGPLDRRRRIVSSPTILASWINLAPGAELARRLRVPVHVENDADTGAIGEKRFGCATGYSDFLYIKASHGIGAAIMIGGRCHRGARGIVGEIGHTHLDGATNRCRCGNQGCLESVISVPEVRRQLAQTHLRQGPDGQVPPLTEVAADPVGARVLADAGRMVGRVVADGCIWLNPEAIVLGGQLGVSGAPFAEGLRESLGRYAQPATVAAIEVRSALLAERAEVMGAIATALERCVAA